MDPRGQGDRQERLSQLYLAIISRYKQYIEEKEELSVAELPTLVNPKESDVIKKAEEIKQQFSSYTYNSDFLKASKLAFDFVMADVEEIVMPIQFWLVPSETLSFHMGDKIDRNVLLCSLLIALGNHSSKVLVIKNESSMRIYTHFGFDYKVFLADLNSGLKEFNSYEEMLKGFGVGEEDTAYEFNNQIYADIYPK